MSPIKDLHFHLVSNVLNSSETFSEGDTVAGTVSFTLAKETKVKSLRLKMKGDARVRWSEGMGDDSSSYSDHRRYFKVKTYLVTQKSGGTTLPCGLHSFNFELVIPQGNFPSSFKGHHGEIVYTLEAEISRSWRIPSKARRELNFFSRSPANHVQMLSPYSASLCKDVGVFSKRKVQMSVSINKNVYSPGETAVVVVSVSNFSSKEMRPKIKLQRRIEYRAGISSTGDDRVLAKEVGETLKGDPGETVTFQLQIPSDINPTIANCDIISVEYFLKVYLDISFAPDPELLFPLLIVPPAFSHLCSAAAVGAPSYSDFPPPAPSSFYGFPAQGLENQLPPSGLPPSVRHAPPLFPEEEPPSYQSLWPRTATNDCTRSYPKKTTSNEKKSL